MKEMDTKEGSELVSKINPLTGRISGVEDIENESAKRCAQDTQGNLKRKKRIKWLSIVDGKWTFILDGGERRRRGRRGREGERGELEARACPSPTSFQLVNAAVPFPLMPLHHHVRSPSHARRLVVPPIASDLYSRTSCSSPRFSPLPHPLRMPPSGAWKKPKRRKQMWIWLPQRPRCVLLLFLRLLGDYPSWCHVVTCRTWV